MNGIFTLKVCESEFLFFIGVQIVHHALSGELLGAKLGLS